MSTAVAERVVLSDEQQALLAEVRRSFALVESQTDEQLVELVRSVAFVFDGYTTFSAWVQSDANTIVGTKRNGDMYAKSLRAVAVAWMMETGKAESIKKAYLTIAALTPKKATASQVMGACSQAADGTRSSVDEAIKLVAVETATKATAELISGDFLMDFSKKSADSIKQIETAIAAGLSLDAVRAHAEVQIQRYQQLLASL